VQNREECIKFSRVVAYTPTVGVEYIDLSTSVSRAYPRYGNAYDYGYSRKYSSHDGGDYRDTDYSYQIYSLKFKVGKVQTEGMIILLAVLNGIVVEDMMMMEDMLVEINDD